MSKFNYGDYWFNYVLMEDPIKIKNSIKEKYITSEGLKIHLDIYDEEKDLDRNYISSYDTSAKRSQYYSSPKDGAQPDDV